MKRVREFPGLTKTLKSLFILTFLVALLLPNSTGYSSRQIQKKPEVFILNDQFVFYPSLYTFDIQNFLSNQPGKLKDFQIDRNGENIRAADIVEAISHFYSINPQVLLALLELQSSLLSDPNPTLLTINNGMKIEGIQVYGFYEQVNSAAKEMFNILYSKAVTDINGMTILEKDAASSTIMEFLNTNQSSQSPNIDAQVSDFILTFREYFGDPTTLHMNSDTSASNIPDFHYPWPAGGSADGWKQVGDPHYNSGWPLADNKTVPGGNYPTGLDFVPPHALNVATASINNPCSGCNDPRSECQEANRGIDRNDWAIASDTGNVVYSGFSQVVVQHNSEWGSLYYHIAAENRIQPGPLPSDLRIGHPSSEANQGGYSTQSHVHFSILYGGVFQNLRTFQDIRQFTFKEWGNTPSIGVTLYEDANYGGRRLVRTQSDEDLCDNIITGSTTNPYPCFDPSVITWNDRISSIKVSPGYRVILALHSRDWDIDQYGQSQAKFNCGEDIPDFTQLKFSGTNISLNDNVSKVIIAKCTSTNVSGNLLSFSSDDPCVIDQPPSTNDSAQFTGYESIPDGTNVSPGQSLTKTWRVKNTGSSTWGSGYKLAFRSGEQMGAPTTVDVPNTAPGQEVNINVPLTAPSTAGDHIGKFQLRNPQGTFFGDVLWVEIKVVGSNPGGNVTLFDVTPSSPSEATSVHIVGRARYFTDFRSMRFVIGNEVHEMTNFRQVGDLNEISVDWNTASLARGNYAIYYEVAKNGDPDWYSAERQVKVYTLTGTPASNNHAPDRPQLKSPYNWYLKDQSGSPASVELCVYPASDPDGNTVQYYYEVKDQGGGVYANSGWVTSSCWTRSYDPNTYSWRVKSGDGSTESDWSTDTWNFTVAKGGVYIGDHTIFSPDTNDTHVCVFITYDGIQAPEVYAWLNKAADGSESGEWRLLDHYGPNTTPDCTQPNYHGFWIHSPEYEQGTHKLRISAVKRDSGANAKKDTSYTISYIRPSDVYLLAPSTKTNNGTWWNSRTIHFEWSPSLRAQNYTLRVSTNSNPWADPSPLLDQTIGSSTTSYDYTFTQDYARLYLSVRASNTAGSTDSGSDVWFGIDTVNPTCQVQTLPAVTYENVFQVNWSGTDDSAGLRSFDIQYRDSDRGEWKEWLVNAPASKPYELFTGQPGHTYYFNCRATDNAGNSPLNYPSDADTFIKVDPAARPPAPWWNTAYSYKRGITILNNMASIPMAIGYPVHLQFSTSTVPTAAEIYNASQSSTKCNDIRIVYNDATELNRIVDTCTSNKIDIWFRSQVSIAGGASNNTSHQIYYGNPNPGNPPSQVDKVFWPEIDSNTLRYYIMREGTGNTLYDATNHGNASMSSALNWTQAGKFGPAVQFPTDEGPEPRPAIDDGSSNMPVNSFTIEFWLKRGQIDGGNIANQDVNPYPVRWYLRIMGQLRLTVYSTSGSDSHAYSNTSLNDQRFYSDFHHFAITFNGGNEVRFYIDGQLDAIQTLSQSGLRSSTCPLRIGASNINTGRLSGQMFGFVLSEGAKTDFSYGQFANITTEPTTAAGQVQTPPEAGSPDLVFTNLSAFPNPDGGILVQATVENQGNLETTNGFFTDLYVDHLPTGAGDYTGSLQFWVNEPIASGQTLTLTTVIDNLSIFSGRLLKPLAPSSEITGTLYAQADSTGAVPELVKTNNIYTLGTEVCVATTDAFEEDNTPATASLINKGEVQVHNFDTPGDEDWIKLNAEEGEKYTIHTFNLGSSADTYMYLYDNDGETLLASNDDYGGTLASQIEWTAPTTGTYYLLIRHWNPNISGCGTKYEISLGERKIFLPIVRR